MSGSLMERLTSTPEGMRLYQQERAIQELTDLVCQIMDERKVTRAELAARLGKTKGYVTQLLDGRTNMTVRTIADVLGALDCAIHFQDGPLSATVGEKPFLTMTVPWAQADCWVQPTQPLLDTGEFAGELRMVS